HDRDQVAGTSIHLRLRSQKSLADAVGSSDGRNGKVDFGPASSPIVIPVFFGQEIGREAPRDSELRGVGLMDSTAVDGTRHGIKQISHENAFKLLPAIDGRNQVEFIVVDRTDKSLQPVRFYSGRIG